MSHFNLNLKPLFLALNFVFANSVLAASLVGIPSEISGNTPIAEPEVKRGINNKGVKVGEYIREQTDRLKPATERNDGRIAIQPVNKPGEQPVSEFSEENDADYVAAPVVRKSQVRFVLPEGMNVIDKNSAGAASINGDKPGTYLVKVPPLLFSRIVLPFEAEFTTPFPDQVVIKRNQGALLVAPKSAMPVNLVIFHPKKPEVSVGIVLVPDGQEIPATIDVAFDPLRLPVASNVEASEDGATRKITTLGIASRINDRNEKAAMRFEKSGDHITVLENIHRLVSQGLVPDGYSLEVITEGATGTLCSDRRLMGEFVQRMHGERFTVDVFSVANAHDDYVSFNEENCYRRGVASVQFFPSRNLAPGKTAELVIVHANDDVKPPLQQRRPTQVRLGQ